MFGVDAQTIRVWVNEGKLQCVRTPNGHRRFEEDYILSLLNQTPQKQKTNPNSVVIYARVSTKKQAEAGNLDRQITRLVDYAVANTYKIDHVYREVASGVNENRKELTKLLDFLHENKGVKVLIEYKDRLARFGYNYLEKYIQASGNELVVLDAEEKDEQQELVEDLMAITTSFSARIYGKRGGRKLSEKKLQKVMEGLFDENNEDLFN